jgi:hypothetical protein
MLVRDGFVGLLTDAAISSILRMAGPSRRARRSGPPRRDDPYRDPTDTSPI